MKDLNELSMLMFLSAASPIFFKSYATFGPAMYFCCTYWSGNPSPIRMWNFMWNSTKNMNFMFQLIASVKSTFCWQTSQHNVIYRGSPAHSCMPSNTLTVSSGKSTFSSSPSSYTIRHAWKLTIIVCCFKFEYHPFAPTKLFPKAMHYKSHSV